MRALDGIYLTSQATFHQSGITEGEVLQLVSPEGRRVQNLVRRLLDEIEAELRDQATGEIRDTLTDEAWERVTKKLDEIEKTHTGGNRVAQVRAWVDQIGGPSGGFGIYENIKFSLQPFNALSTGVKIGFVLLSLVAASLATTSGVILYNLFNTDSNIPVLLTSTELPIPATGPTEQVAETPTPTLEITEVEITETIPPTIIPTETPVPTATETEPPTATPVEDLDGDGLTNIYEHDIVTDPINQDSDEDQLMDGA